MEVIVFKADYYDKFKCLGSNCQISCCNYNWKILIDKTTYQKYKKFSSIGKKVDGDFTRLVRTSVEINPDANKNKNKNEYNYGQIKHIIDSKAFIFGSDAYKATQCYCPFSTLDNLCDMQNKLGEDELSLTCKLFPRNLNKIFDDYNQTMTCECEAVCDLLYKIKEPLKFKKEKVNINEKHPINNSINEELKNHNNHLNHFQLIRATCIKILQSREIKLDDRIVLIGLFLSKISNMKMDENESDKIRKYIKSFLASQQEYLEYFDIKVNNDNTSKKAKYSNPHKILLESINFDEIEQGVYEKKLLISIKNNLVVYYNNYQLIQNKSAKMLKEIEYYLENVFVNLAMEKSLPFSTDFDNSTSFVKKIDLIDNYIAFVWSYVSLKVMLTSGLTLEPKLNEQTLIKITVLHHREIVGSTKRLNEMITILKELGYESISQISTLIKNA